MDRPACIFHYIQGDGISLPQVIVWNSKDHVHNHSLKLIDTSHWLMHMIQQLIYNQKCVAGCMKLKLSVIPSSLNSLPYILWSYTTDSNSIKHATVILSPVSGKVLNCLELQKNFKIQ